MDDLDKVTRGNLTHWYKPGYAHFVSYRLAGSIPARLVKQWRGERERKLKQIAGSQSTGLERREWVHKAFFTKYDEYLDSQNNVRWLGDDRVAEIVRENLYHHHGSLYELLSWCIMPTHVHILIQPLDFVQDAASAVVGESENSVNPNLRYDHSPSDDAASVVCETHSDEIADTQSPLSRIMHSLKSYTANQANQVLGRTGAFWQRESYDHWVRDLDELENIVAYINANPAKAGLTKTAHEYRFSSAFDRFQIDGSRCGMVGNLRDDWK